MSARARAVQPPRAARRWTAAGRRRPLRTEVGSITPAVLGIIAAVLALCVLLANFVAVLAAHATARTAADAAARGALSAWQAATAAPDSACGALAAFADAYDAISAAADHYAAVNGARLDPERPPALVAWRDGVAVQVAVLQPLGPTRITALLDEAHRSLHSSSVARWPAPAPDWAAAEDACPDRLP